MTINLPRLSQFVIVGLSRILIAVILAGGFAFFISSRSSSNAFAATTCAQAPTREHCNNQDPETEGCAADAVTLGPPAAVVENGFPIGRVERRWSATCQSWWGRVFDTRTESHANMYIEVAGTTLSGPPTFVSSTSRILYSFMVFDAAPTQQVPAITGSLEIDGITASPRGTIPAITPPGTIR